MKNLQTRYPVSGRLHTASGATHSKCFLGSSGVIGWSLCSRPALIHFCCLLMKMGKLTHNAGSSGMIEEFCIKNISFMRINFDLVKITDGYVL